MDDLILLLEQFNLILKQQVQLFHEFIFVLDAEEKSIASYCFLDLEKAVISKDQHTRLSASFEEKRVVLLKKICSMIAFDTRNQNLSLPLFKSVFFTYMENVKKLLNKDVMIKLEKFYSEFLIISSELSSAYDKVSKRIFRNQVILKKVLRNINLSISLFQSEVEAGMNYDAMGKAQTIFNHQKPVSSIRVTV